MTSVQVGTSELDWGSSPITSADASRFAERVSVSPLDRERIRRTLADFPVACEVRGMFFQGLVDTIAKARGKEKAQALLREANVRTRFVPFTLMPHRDFYKLYFLASAALHPGRDLEHGFERIAEDFYPTFRASMVGRTLSAFIGDEPMTVLERLGQAYRLSIPWNEHNPVADGANAAVWKCKVEPSELYPATFRGIIRGTMRSHGVREPEVELVSKRSERDAFRYEFAVRW